MIVTAKRYPELELDISSGWSMTRAGVVPLILCVVHQWAVFLLPIYHGSCSWLTPDSAAPQTLVIEVPTTASGITFNAERLVPLGQLIVEGHDVGDRGAADHHDDDRADDDRRTASY